MAHQTTVIRGYDGVSEHTQVDKHYLRFSEPPPEGEQIPAKSSD